MTCIPAREGRQPGFQGHPVTQIFLLSLPLPLFLCWRPAGCQQSRFREPGQIRPGTKLSCCRASRRPLTARRLGADAPSVGSSSMPPFTWAAMDLGPARGQGDKAQRNRAGSRMPHSTLETQATLPEWQ